MVIKRRFHFFKAFLTLAIIFLMVALGAFSSQSVSAQGPTPTPSLPSDLTAQLAQQGARISTHAQTGLAHFIAADPNRPIRPSAALPANPSRDQVARGFLDQFGKLFGVSNQSQELIVAQQKTPDNRRAFVRFQQVYQGVPVFGGELNVQVTAANAVTSANGEISPKLNLSTTPAITAATARQSALDAVAKSYKLASASLTATAPQLWIYDPTLVGPDSGPVRLVWRMDVSSTGLPPIRELVLVDAQSGGIQLHFNQISTSGSAGSPAGKAPTRKIMATDNTSHAASAAVLGVPLISVYNMNGSADMQGLPGTLICTESDPTDCDSDLDAQKAYQFAVATYNFYVNYLGRDSIDGQGMRIISSVHFGINYPNAFWDGQQMVYGDGYSTADDVVGHELTHGVTQYESALFYYYESGAINESLSDVFGEFIDLTDGLGNDSAAVRWLAGEDLPIGAVRNMKNPPAFGDPDRMLSPYYYTGLGDYGGVHFNSGVNNKTAYLITDGAAFNGQTVSGLGITKAAKIYYEVQTNLLTSGADYADLYDALYQGCLNLIGTSGITSGDCQQVRNATTAVQMNQSPAGYNPEAIVCPVGQAPSNLFYDNLENGFANWSFGVVSGTEQWTTTNTRWGGPNAHSGVNALYGDDTSTSSSSYAAMVNSVTLPANAYLHFDHFFDLEWSYDGGLIEYSADGGPWVNAGSLIDSGQAYTYTADGVGGVQSFTGSSYGYVSTRLNLSSLAGKNVIFRWRLGTDVSYFVSGWWVDDVRIYTCLLPPTITSFTPVSGPQGTTVTVTGTRFTSATAVKFNGTSASFSLVSDTRITATVPAGATTGKISVTTPGGTATSASNFTVITAPAIDVQGPEPTAIADGGVYNMGATTIGTPLVKTITVNNPGTQALSLLTNPPTVTGAGFSAGTFGAVSVAPGGSTTFALTCNATAAGTPVSGTVSFGNNVSGKNPFNFTVNCQVFLPPADAPTALTATALSQTSINVAWNDNSSVETAYKIERSPDGTNFWTEIGSVGANVTSYQDTLLDCDTTYVYRVRAYRSSDGAYSLYSNADGATTAVCSLLYSPTLLAPDNGSLTKNNAPTFTWAAVTGADSYQIQIDDSDDFGTPVQSGAVNGLSYTASTLVDGTTYSWRVRGLANNNSETGPWSTAWSVSIDQKRLPAPALSAPANNINIAITMPTFTWLAVTGATQYELQVDVDPAFPSPPVDHTLGNVTKYVATADNLQYGSTYYWRVRAGAASAPWSNWSSVRSFALTIMKSPTNGAYVVSHNQAFSWSAVAGAQFYDLQISPDSDFSSGFWGSFGGTQVTIIGIPWDQYYWRVNVTTNAGTSPWMAAWRLTVTPTLPAAPTLIAPTASFVTNNAMPFFYWNDTTTVDGGPFDYQIQITRGTSFYNPVQDVRQSATNYTADPLPDGGYSWRVRAINNVNTAGPWSVVRSFTIDTTPPVAPVLTAPKDWSITTTTRPAFSWSAASGAKYYRLSMFSGDDCSAPTWLWDSPNQTALSYTPTLGQALTVGSSYCWQVTAGDAADNWGAPSAFFHLTVSSGVVPAPGVPTLLAPAIGSPWPDSGLPDFHWSMATTGNFFEIQIATAPTFANPAIDALTATDQYIYSPPLSSLAAGAYSWRVRAINSGRVAGAWSATRTFTVTSLVPGTPILLTPANGASTTSRNPALTWQAVSGAKSYNVQVSQYTDFHSPVVNKIGAITTSYTPIAGEALSYGTTYYWHVQAVNAGGTPGDWSQTFTLTASVHKSPLDGSSTKTVKPTFAWVAVTGATYTLQYSTDPGFGPGAITVTPTGTQYTLPTALAPDKYYWRVQVTVSGVPTMMPAWTLYVATTIPIAPTLTDPANNAATNDNTPTFAWKPVTGGQTYEVQIDDLSTFASPQQDGTTAIGALSYTANPLADGKYYWRARAIGSTGAPGPWSAAWTVTIDTVAPATPIQTGPFNGTNITNPQLTLRWNASAGATAYEVRLDTVEPLLTPPIPNGAALTYKPVVTLAYGTYYWQVRALDAVGNVSDWSPAESFSVVAGMSIAAPRLTPTPATATPILSGKVTLLTPTGATATEHPTYTWTADTQATKYYLVVSGPTGNVVGQWFDSAICSNGVCQATPAAPALTNGRYTFWVETWIGGSLGSWSDSLSFAVTNQTPAMAVQLGPVGLLTTTPATFSWRAATNAQSYYLVVQKADGTQLLGQWYDGAQVCVGDTCSVTPALNLTNGVYTWWVTTWGGGVLGAPSAGLMFTANGLAPATPAPTVPVAPTFVPNTN